MQEKDYETELMRNFEKVDFNNDGNFYLIIFMEMKSCFIKIYKILKSQFVKVFFITFRKLNHTLQQLFNHKNLSIWLIF